MIDIEFYMKVHSLKCQLLSGGKFDRQYIYEQFESMRSRIPVIYNIETTNACNMRCVMCPRTTMMTRKVEMMGDDIFARIIEQIKPFSDESWQRWQNFVEESYHIPRNDMSENHFFLYIIPRVITLHGYGDPLLDKHIAERCKNLFDKNIPSYFSCNPANIDIKRMQEIFENGLGYIKYSIESVDDIQHKQIRGNASNFTESYRKILQLLEIKEKNGYKTTIVITMLNLKDWQENEYQKLRDAFKGLNVYIYLKSQDQQWYQSQSKGTGSIHWQEFCQFPWTSMTIKSNGEVVMCVEDFNNEIILGDARTKTLYDIWNGDKYREFRESHFNLAQGIKCTQQCDMRLIGSYLT